MVLWQGLTNGRSGSPILNTSYVGVIGTPLCICVVQEEAETEREGKRGCLCREIHKADQRFWGAQLLGTGYLQISAVSMHLSICKPWGLLLQGEGSSALPPLGEMGEKQARAA